MFTDRVIIGVGIFGICFSLAFALGAIVTLVKGY